MIMWYYTDHKANTNYKLLYVNKNPLCEPFRQGYNYIIKIPIFPWPVPPTATLSPIFSSMKRCFAKI